MKPMLDLKKLRENPQLLREMLEKRGIQNPWGGETEGLDLDKFTSLLHKNKELLTHIEALRSRRNLLSEQFAKDKKADKDITDISKQISANKSLLTEKENEFTVENQKLTDALLRIPNFLHVSVPLGKSIEDNVAVRSVGEVWQFPFEARTHWEIGESLGILDFATAGKISGSRFFLLKGLGAALERALISFMLDLHVNSRGYTEIFAPYMVNRQTMEGTGQLPKFEEEIFKIEKEDLYLIPTAEVSVTNLHRDTIMDEADLPKKYVCYSACFRREAGSYGKDTKGLIRNHQFNKVELVWFSKPENSFDDLEKLVLDAEEVLKRIGVPYRVMSLCSGDTGFASAKTYDLEIWMPGEKRWREISSCSCFTDFQARRMNIKHKTSSGKKELVHTLNGSGVAVGRLFAAVLENYQEKDGSVRIPEVLRPYIGKERITL